MIPPFDGPKVKEKPNENHKIDPITIPDIVYISIDNAFFRLIIPA